MNNRPNANATARDNIERSLTEWGRFRLVMDRQESDLILSVSHGHSRQVSLRTGSDGMNRLTMKGGPIDQRPAVDPINR